MRSKSFVIQARKQSLAISKSAQEQDDLAFIESIADWTAK
ncbi:MAG: antitoxin MazE-like protein [Steroidobacteraceae bacterium]